MSFEAGFDKGVTFQQDGLNFSVSLNVTGHSWSEQIDKLDVTHSGTAGYQALLAGILRGDGNVKANIDSSNYPWFDASGGIRAGVNGVLTFNYGTHYSVPCMIIKVHSQSAVEGKVEYDFDVSLNVFAGDGVASHVRAVNAA